MDFLVVKLQKKKLRQNYLLLEILYQKGEPFKGEIVYKENENYVFRE